MSEDNDAQARADVRARNNLAHERIVDAMRAKFAETGEVYYLASEVQKSISGMTVGVFQRVIAARPSTIVMQRERNGHGHHEHTFIGPHADLLRQWRGRL